MYCCKLPSPQLPSMYILRRRRRRRTPVVGPVFDVEEAPSQKALTSRDSHQPRKTGSSPIRNIGRRSPPSLPGPTPSRHTCGRILHHLPQPHSSQDRRTSRVTHLCRHAATQRQVEATPTAWTPQASRRNQQHFRRAEHGLRDHYS
jgi:hypothetical protein